MHKNCFTAHGWKILNDLAPILSKLSAVLAGGRAPGLRESAFFLINLSAPGARLPSSPTGADCYRKVLLMAAVARLRTPPSSLLNRRVSSGFKFCSEVWSCRILGRTHVSVCILYCAHSGRADAIMTLLSVFCLKFVLHNICVLK